MAELTLTGLRVLREVAARGSFTAAADSLGYTQSAISRQVAGLESAAGTPLFERGSRGVSLTDAGHALLRRAGKVLEEVDTAQRELEGMSEGATGRLCVGAFPTAVAALLPRALAAFRERHPGIDVSLREGSTPSQVRRLVSGTADVAVIGVLPEGAPTGDRRIVAEPLLEDPLLLAVGQGHPLARRRVVDLNDLAEERWIAASPKANETYLGAWEWAEWRPRVEFIAREWTAKLGLVSAGLGVTLVPGLAADAVRPDVALVRIRSERPASRTIHVASRAGADPPPHVRVLGDLLHETASELTVQLERRLRGT
ncbi:MAG TPA: LysR family transcriptional regulator [Solirubrobacterales bacterium]